MAKLTINVGSGEVGPRGGLTGGPSQEWLDMNLHRADVSLIVKRAFADYLDDLGFDLSTQYEGGAPGKSQKSVDNLKTSAKSTYMRAHNLNYGGLPGHEASITYTEKPGFVSGELEEAIGQPRVMFSGGIYKVMWGTDKRLSELDYYLHKTLRENHGFPKLFMPPEYLRGGMTYEAAVAKAARGLQRLETRDKKK